jgi:diguanylate cyclase (GGDEF)-like protein
MRSATGTRPTIVVLAAIVCLGFSRLGLAAAGTGGPVLGGPIFSSLGTREGLPNASVSSIAQDRQGFLWFGTQGGLARYDGYSFKLFRHEPFDIASLPHDTVQSIYFDGDKLWAGTYGGLARLDLGSERFTSYANDPSRPDSLSNDVVTSMTKDSRGSLWVGTLSGLNCLDGSTGRFQRFFHNPSDPGSLPSDSVRVVRLDREGRLWIGTSGGGLARFDYRTRSFVTYRAGSAGSILSDYVMAIDQDSSGCLWIGTWYGGLSSFDPDSDRFENHPLADGRVYTICAAEDGVVYVGTWGTGLYEYDIASRRFIRYSASGYSGSLADDVVYSLFRDVSGELWIGTNGGGLSKLSPERKSCEAISAGPDGMPGGKVYAVFIDRRGYLWVSVYNEGLARCDPATGVWRRYRHNGRHGSLPDDIVNFLHEDERGELWVGTNEGLARYEAASDSFEEMGSVTELRDPLSSTPISAMEDDFSGGLWFGTSREGLDYWDRSKGKLEHYAYDPAREDSLSDDFVTVLGRDAQGRLWVGTNRGLNRFEKGRFIRYLYDPRKPAGVSSDSIRDIFLDSHKIMWIGTAGGGIMRYEAETDSFVSYTMSDGLPNDTIMRVLEDDSGDLWVATQAGLAVYDRRGGRFRSLSVTDDIQGAEFFSGAFRATDGSLYFGTLGRLYHFFPERYEFNDHKPPVVLTFIQAKGRPPIVAAATASIAPLKLSWRENSISLRFAALDYQDPERNRYSYRLDGFDADWSPAGTEHSAVYTNLPGGDYVFRVRASNNDGLWNEEGLSLSIHVGFAPWASPLAFVIYAFLLAGGGLSLGFLSRRAALQEIRIEADGLRARLAAASVTMENAALIDPLTGLPNRRKAEEYLELALARASSRKIDLAVLMVDIDNLRSYNDRNGKAAGDECLRRIAETLSSGLKNSSGIAARYGGEEFLLVLEERGLEEALAEGEAFRRAVEELALSWSSEDPRALLTISVGCASVQPEAGHTPASLIAAAERALVAAKIRGRNRVSD